MMMRPLALLLAVFVAIPSGVAAQTISTKSVLYSSIQTQFPDNSIGAITPSRLRAVTDNIVASMQPVATVNAQLSTSYTLQSGDAGKLVTFTNVSSVAVTVPDPTGLFTIGWSTMLKNNGSNNVVVTPATPTTVSIDSMSSVSLSPGNSILIVSDGTNYQTWGIATQTSLYVDERVGVTETLSENNCGGMVTVDNVSTVTLNLVGTMPAGCAVSLLQKGTGVISPTATSGATLQPNRSGFTVSAGQWAVTGVAVYENLSGTAAKWVFFGDGAP